MIKNLILVFGMKLVFTTFVVLVLGIIVIDSKLAAISLGSMFFCLLSPPLCFLYFLFLCLYECVLEQTSAVNSFFIGQKK